MEGTSTLWADEDVFECLPADPQGSYNYNFVDYPPSNDKILNVWYNGATYTDPEG